MGKLTFFLGLHVKQKKDGIFISHDKYVAEILRKFGLTDGKSASTRIDTEKPLLKDPSIYACARFQVTPKDSHLHAVKRIFRYLKGKPHLGLWYPKDLPFDLVTYSKSDYAGASLDRKSTTGGCQFLGCRLICWQSKKQTVVVASSTEAEYVVVLSGMESLKRMEHVTHILSAGLLTSQQMVLNSPCLTHIKNWLVQIKQSLVNDITRLQALVDKKKVVVTEATIRDTLRLDDEEGVECLLNEEIFADLARMGYEKPSTKLTFYKAFFSRQWKFLIHTRLQCMSAKRTLWIEFSSSMASAVICLSSGRKFNFSKYIFDSLVRNVDSPTKFYMYPRFLQLMIRKQVGDLSTHTTKYTSPALTRKVFANMRRAGKGFFRVYTPLFEGMVVAQEVGKGVADEVHDEGVPTTGITTEGVVSAADDVVLTVDEEPSIPSPTPLTLPPQPSHDIPSTSQVQPTPPQSPQVQPQSPQLQPQHFHDAGISMNLLQDLMDTSQRIDTSDDTLIDDIFNQGRMIANMDAYADVVLEEAKDVAADAKDGQDADGQDNANIQGRTAESQVEIYNIDLDHANKVLSMQEKETEPAELQEVVDIVTTAKITTKVAAATLTLTAASSRRTKGVVIRDPKESTTTTSIIIHSEAKSKDKGNGILVEEPKPLKKQAQIKEDEKYARELEAELNRTIDWDKVIDHVNKKEKEDKFVKRYQAMKRKPQTEAHARKNMMVYLKNVAGFKIDYFKGMTYDDIRPIFEKHFDSNVAFLQKTKEQIDEVESRALKRINETLAEKATKRKKLDEEVE
nr:hypothetical protein [Tanacetum cinerariifolium]